MQELLHNDYDIYLKDLEAGESPADPHVISIPRGMYPTCRLFWGRGGDYLRHLSS